MSRMSDGSRMSVWRRDGFGFCFVDGGLEVGGWTLVSMKEIDEHQFLLAGLTERGFGGGKMQVDCPTRDALNAVRAAITGWEEPVAGTRFSTSISQGWVVSVCHLWYFPVLFRSIFDFPL